MTEFACNFAAIALRHLGHVHRWIFLCAAVMLMLATTRLRAVEPPGYDPARFEITALATELERPLELAVASDGRVYFIELAGALKRFDPNSERTETIGLIKVNAENENGLIGLALDPKFSENHWIYLQYSPPDYSGQYISRFSLVGDKLDLTTEKVLFKYEEQRKECCHHAGSMAFGPDDCLYVGTGDNTHPGGDSSGYAPLDERPGREAFDSQRSAANSRSGGGKILRIKPTPEGGYVVPDGNLFPRDGSRGLPEIYIMGCRNPWKLNVDARSGFVYWGDVGPDAGGPGPRGPQGFDEINQARAAGNFGWPYFIANNRAYHDFDYATGKAGAPFDPAHPVNHSINNSGAKELPPAQPALLYYPYGGSPEFPELNGGGGRTACAGPVYYFNPSLTSSTKFPAAFDRTLFIYEWSRHWIKAVHLDANGKVERIEPFMPNHGCSRPVDMAFGPDGAMYLLVYGQTWGVNKDARLVRIDYAAGNRKPMAKASATNNVGREPLDAMLSSVGTLDKDAGDKLRYEWWSTRTFESSEPVRLISQEANPRITFSEPGVYNVELRVFDAQGAKASAFLPVMVGNSRPVIRITQPQDGAFFDPATPLAYKIVVDDPEDGTSDEHLVDTQDREFLDPDAPSRVTMNVTVASGRSGDTTSQDPPGLRIMKGSDCFNCHAVDQKRVGPPLLEIANKYRSQAHAIEASVKRVREGSSGVWGKIPMIPHAQHTDEELQKMVAWIYALETGEAPKVHQGFVGSVPPAETKNAGLLMLQANYVDLGHRGIPPITASETVTVRSRHIQAENAEQIHGLRILESQSAEGGKFLGAIDHGHFIRIAAIDVQQVGAITARVASAGAGGQIEVHLDKVDGPKLAIIDVKVNGQWESWYDVTVPAEKMSGRHDLFFVFVNPGNRNALMNLDSIYFRQ